MNPVISSSGNFQDLTLKQIYREIDKTLCKVTTAYGTVTGICLGENFIGLPFHVLREVKTLDTMQDTRDVDIHCTYRDVEYLHTLRLPKKKEFLWERIDFLICSIQDETFPKQPSLEPFDDEIEAGEEVYFGGFPLTQEAATFHKGVISSVSMNGEIRTFTIDGTVVPGNSGGPVFVQRDGRLQIIGVIVGEMVDFEFSPESHNIFQILRAMKGQKAGMSVELSFQRSDGSSERRSVDYMEAIALVVDLVEKNLSTGIGRAFCFNDVLTLTQIPAASLQSGVMPTMRHEPRPYYMSRYPAYARWFHQVVKPNHTLCEKMIGRSLEPADLMNADEDKRLYRQYIDLLAEGNLYSGFQQDDSDANLLKTLSKHILEATPKSMKSNRSRWMDLLQEIKDRNMANEDFLKKIAELETHLS